MESESKVTVYVAVKDEAMRGNLEMAMMTLYLDIAVFVIADLKEFEQRLVKTPPNLVITDAGFLEGSSILKDGVTKQERAMTSYIVFGPFSQKEDYLDEMMLGKIQFYDSELDEDGQKGAFKKAFKYSLESKGASFFTKQIKANDLLMKVGDSADKVFILKKGKLQAFMPNEKGEKTVLGDISPGEFVGEMAYFNSEPRVASVVALVDSEVIEIPIASFERTIYEKPAWAMKLVETLSKRLKKYISK